MQPIVEMHLIILEDQNGGAWRCERRGMQHQYMIDSMGFLPPFFAYLCKGGKPGCMGCIFLVGLEVLVGSLGIETSWAGYMQEKILRRQLLTKSLAVHVRGMKLFAQSMCRVQSHHVPITQVAL